MRVTRAERVQRSRVVVLTARLMWIGIAGVLLGGSFVAGAWAHREGHIYKGRNYVLSIPARVKEQLGGPALPTMFVDMKFKQVRKIEEKWAEALQRGVLHTSDTDDVPATIRVGEKVVPVKMRLKGDRLDHVQLDRWSFRVKVKGDDSIFGMRVFSLQHPRTRNWDQEWLFHQHLRREGVLAVRYFFVRVVFNGEDKGIYAVEEHFSKELLESQGRRESVIVRLDETYFWAAQSGLREQVGGLLKRAQPYDSFGTTVEAFQKKKVAVSPVLSSQRDAAVQLLYAFYERQLPASQVFKVPETARFMAVAELWTAWHALGWLSVRYYYDPIEAKLEPVGFNADPFPVVPRLGMLDRAWCRQVLRDPEMAAAVVRELDRVSQPTYLHQLRRDLGKSWQATLGDLQREWPLLESDIWEKLETKQLFIQRILAERQLVLARSLPEGPAEANARDVDGRKITIKVGNPLSLPVVLLGLQLANGERVSLRVDNRQPVVLLGRNHDEVVQYQSFDHWMAGDAQMPTHVLCRLAGKIETQAVPIQSIGFRLNGNPIPTAPALSELLEHHAFLELGDTDGFLQIRRGEWDVRGDLVLPQGYGIVAKQGTTLRFEPGAVFVSRGPIHFAGSEEEPIRLVPREESWAGLVVLNAPPSTWKWVEVRETESIDRPGWTLTGGVTFYRSPVYLERCSFLGARGEDALNVVSAHIQCDASEFRGCLSDAFDGDFVTGSFDRCVFESIGGDAIDLRGSQMQVTSVRAVGVKDKVLSAGEDSRVVAYDITIERSGFGVVSKDWSRVTVVGLTVRDSRYALAAYVKKREYGPAFLEVERAIFENVDTRALVQTGSTVMIDQETVPATDVDVEELYAELGAAQTAHIDQPVQR